MAVSKSNIPHIDHLDSTCCTPTINLFRSQQHYLAGCINEGSCVTSIYDGMQLNHYIILIDYIAGGIDLVIGIEGINWLKGSYDR